MELAVFLRYTIANIVLHENVSAACCGLIAHKDAHVVALRCFMSVEGVLL